MFRRRAAAAADDVEPAVARPFGQLRREGFRRLRKTCGRERIGETGIGIRAYVTMRRMREFLDVRLHLAGAERAIQSDHKRIGMRDGDEKRFHRLATEDSSRPIHDRPRNDERDAFASRFKQLRYRGDSGFWIKGVKKCFDEEEIDS